MVYILSQSWQFERGAFFGRDNGQIVRDGVAHNADQTISQFHFLLQLSKGHI